MRNTRTIPQLLFRIFIRPVFPFIQWLGKTSGIFTEARTVEGPYRRQPYRVGYVREGITSEQVRTHLYTHGFFDERIAYKDPGQTLSMRRLHDSYPDQQYHIRVFEDGEVRGHLEYTPEDRPIAHMRETLYENTARQFQSWLGTLLR